MKKIFLIFLIVFFEGVMGQIIYDDNEGPNCPATVPEDRLDWCTDSFTAYKCTADDETSKKEEEVEFMQQMQKLSQLDCIFEQLDEKQQLFPKNNWQIRFDAYNKVVPKIKECNNCSISDTPEKYFSCWIPLRTQISEYVNTEVEKLIKIIEENGFLMPLCD